MENEKFKNLSELIGAKVNIKESDRSLKKKEQKFFLDFIENLCQIEAINTLLETVGVHTEKYDTPQVRSLRMLMEKEFGEDQTGIILWWVFESLTPEGDVYPLMDEDGKKYILKTPLQLYKFLKKYYGK